MFKVNNKDTRGVFIVNFEYISHHVLVFLLLTLNMLLPAGMWFLEVKYDIAYWLWSDGVNLKNNSVRQAK